MFKARKKLTLLTSAVLVSALVLSGCGSSGNTDTSKDGGVFRFGEVASPTSIDPAFIEENVGGQIGQDIHDGLVQFNNKTLEVEPDIAEKWEPSADGTVYTFHLNSKAVFNDGSKITADDVIKSWTRVVDKDTASPVAFPFKSIKGFDDLQSGKTKEFAGLKKIDDATLEVTLSAPDASFLKALGHTAASVIKVDAADKAGKDYGTPSSTPETMITAGPFKFVEWKADDHVTIEKNTKYFLSNVPHVDQVVYRIFKDESTALNEFRAGNLEYVEQLPPGQRQAVIKEFPGQTIQNVSLVTQYLGFNMQKAPFKDNLNLRKAIATGVDTQSIIDTVMEGISTVANGPLPKTFPSYADSVKYPTYDQAKAKELLSQAGYPDGKGLPEIEYKYNFNEGNQKVAEAVQGQLKEIGINTKLVNLEWGAYIKALQSGESQMFRLAWQADYPDPDNFLTPLFSKDEWGNNNQTYYSNDKVESLLSEGRKELDEKKRDDIYKQIQEQINADQPAAYLFNSTFLHLYAKNVEGLEVSPMEYKDMSRVKLTK